MAIRFINRTKIVEASIYRPNELRGVVGDRMASIYKEKFVVKITLEASLGTAFVFYNSLESCKMLVERLGLTFLEG